MQIEQKCGLCGKKTQLTKTNCCKNLICDDSHKYAMFSYATNSCYRNHDRYTLCSMHYHEKHKGEWKNCTECRKIISKTEMYVWYGTNKFNFKKLENPPKYKPTKCFKCKRVIKLGEETYGSSSNGYECERCISFNY